LIVTDKFPWKSHFYNLGVYSRVTSEMDWILANTDAGKYSCAGGTTPVGKFTKYILPFKKRYRILIIQTIRKTYSQNWLPKMYRCTV